MSLDVQFVEFSPFKLFVTERRLMRDGVAVPLGDRALEILILLVENAGALVSKRELMAKVWAGVTVEEASLRAHIAALRKALGDRREEDRYIATVAGRGYSFVRYVTIRREAAQAPQTGPAQRQPNGLPQRATKIIGREAETRDITDLLSERRFVTIHGAGGIGKTTVGLAVARGLAETFADGVCFVDLGLCSAAETLPDLLAAALGLLPRIDDPVESVINHLRDRHMLLIFDCCEHVIDRTAELVELIFHEAPRIGILATSREPLRVEGENVYALGPLEVPPQGGMGTAGDLLNYSAATLFFERIVAGGRRIELGDEEAQIIGGICRKVEGIALALELVAGRVGTHGLRETAELLDGRLELLWQGRRTAQPRHQTLNAALDWSHDLIGLQERIVLRRLSVFVGHFTLKEAQAVVAGEDVDSVEVIEALAQLVQKSLVNITVGEITRYRLLDITRAYAKAKLVESGEEAAVAGRHARYYQQWLASGRSPASGGVREDDTLGNVCAALAWSFSKEGDVDLGILLAVHSVRLFTDLVQLAECRRWCERALAAMDPGLHGTWYEMVLREALGHALMFTVDNGEQVRASMERALEIAELIDDDVGQFRLIGSLHIYYRRIGEYENLRQVARRAKRVAPKLPDKSAVVEADVMLGCAYNLTGQLAEAQTALNAGLRYPMAVRYGNPNFMSIHSEAQFLMARTLWMQGFPDAAVRMIHEAERTEQKNPLAACQALILAKNIFYFRRDWTIFEDYLDRLVQYASSRSFEPFKSAVAGFRGELLFRRGETSQGLDLIREALVKLHRERYELYTPWLTCTLAEGLARSGYLDQASALMTDEIALNESRGGGYFMPELFRVQGELLALAGDESRAGQCFSRSIAIAEDQTALSWQLRAAASLARLLVKQGRREAARAMLAGVYGRFTEGFATADLREAKALLAALS